MVDTASGRSITRILALGLVTALNDLQRGRDAGGAWKWLIDLGGAF